ncbi:MAG TPA: pilus assembly protein TadG-related protein, partial [Actinomycetota bacterium]|nr:pilus assembly protein TadG-related protein [Actinomycetota bacterium]
VLVLGMFLVVCLVVGLAVDGTKAFVYRRTLQNAADAAALAGAGELDREGYYSSGGGRMVLDGPAAERLSRLYIERRGLTPTRIAVSVGAGAVVVDVEGRAETSFLALAGIDWIPVHVRARARPVAGSNP